MSRNTTFDFVGHFPKLTSLSLRSQRLVRKEISLLCIVGIIGCLGTLFIFNKAWLKDSPLPIEKLGSITISKQTSAIQKERVEESILRLSGQMIVNSEIEFSINNYNPNAIYEIHFGDGDTHLLGSNYTKHTYKMNGEYQVRVSMNYKNQESIVYDSRIEVTGSHQQLLSGI